MKFGRLVGCGALSVLVVAACARDPEGIDRGAFLNELISAVCTSVQGCCNAANMDIDNRKCGDDVKLHMAGVVSDPVLGYDEAQGRACVDAAEESVASCVAIDYAPCIRAFNANRPPGAPCSSAYACDPGPFGFAVCSLTNTCVQPSRGRPGEPCSYSCLETPTSSKCTSLYQTPAVVQVACHSADGLQCRTGEGNTASCQPITGDCRQRPDLPCAAGSTCDQTTGLCVPPLALGAPCTPMSKCVQGAYCGGGVCQPTKPVNGTCIEFYECDSGRCVSNLCVPFSKIASVMCLLRP